MTAAEIAVPLDEMLADLQEAADRVIADIKSGVRPATDADALMEQCKALCRPKWEARKAELRATRDADAARALERRIALYDQADQAVQDALDMLQEADALAASVREHRPDLSVAKAIAKDAPTPLLAALRALRATDAAARASLGGAAS